jgi:hypothetical protein
MSWQRSTGSSDEGWHAKDLVVLPSQLKGELRDCCGSSLVPPFPGLRIGRARICVGLGVSAVFDLPVRRSDRVGAGGVRASVRIHADAAHGSTGMKHTDFASSCTRALSADRRIPFSFLGAVLVAALTAAVCAFASSEGKYDWHEGWREATVIKTENVAALRGRRYFSDCRNRAETVQLASGQFVVLSYKHMGRTWHRVVPLRQGEAYRPGDLVYMNVNSCNTPLVARIRALRK